MQRDITMILAVVFCIVCIASCSSGYPMSQWNGGTLDRRLNTKDGLSSARIKRGILTAIGMLLKSAKFLKREGNVREYEKAGGFRQAARDFKGLNIEDVHDLRLFKWGRSGDKTAVLQYEEGGAEILIWNRGKNHVVDKITYKD